YKLFADLKPVAPSNPNYLVTNARLRAASPTLLVYCRIPFAGNLPVVEAVMPKSSSQRPVETAFLGPTLSRSARFPTRWWYQTADKRPTAFGSGGGGHFATSICWRRNERTLSTLNKRFPRIAPRRRRLTPWILPSLRS